MKDRAIDRIPTAPKSNCFFILNVGQELLDYEKSAKNKLKIQDRLRDGTGAWDEMSISNHNFFKIEGVLTWVRVSKLKSVQPPYDLRTDRATYYCTISSSSERSRKSVFWFWNADQSPAPGLAIVAYLGPYEPRRHGNALHTQVPYQRFSHSRLETFG